MRSARAGRGARDGRFRRVAAAFALVLCSSLGAARAEQTALAFGILNQQSPALTAERWNPILAYLTGKTGLKLRLRMGATVERTDEMMAQGEFDFVFTNHNFKPEYDALGLGVIARWGLEPSMAAIAVAGDSPVGRLQDLAGLRVAFPSAHAFLGYAVPRVALRRAGVQVEEVFAANQEGGLAQLKAGRVDAVAANSRFLQAFVAREGIAVRTIYLSEPFPDLAIVAHKRLDAARVAAVRDALIGMKADPQGAEILAKAACPGFFPANDGDYAAVRAVYRQ